MPKRTIILVLLYLGFVFLAFLYIRDTLNHEALTPKDNTKRVIEKVYDVNVTLNLQTASFKQIYTLKLKSDDSVLHFLEELRSHNGLIYEKKDFAHGTEIESVFNSLPPVGFKWAVLKDGVDITNKIGDILLVDKATYTLTQVLK